MSTKGRSLANLTLHGSLLPDADSAYDLGSSSKKWKSLHLSGNTLFLGDSGTISAGSGGVIELPSIEIGSGNNKVKLQASASGELKTRKVVGGVDQAQEDVGGAAVTTYANFAAFPTSSSNLSGAMGFATDTKAVYMWDDSSWQRMSIGDQLGPRFTTTPSADVTLPTDGSTTTITGVAVDDGGFPVTYDWDAYRDSSGTAILYDSSSLPPQITASSRDSGVITLTPSTSEAHAGSFSFRFKASDGVLSTPAISNVILSFITYVTVDTEQNKSGNTIQPTTNGTIVWYNTTSGSSANTLHLPFGGTNVAPLGKRYIEAKLISGSNSNYRRCMVGIATRYYAEQYASSTGYSGTSTNVAYYYGYNGNKYPGGTPQGLSSINYNDIVQLAYDTDAEKVWLGVNNTWSTLTGDPGAGGAGITIDVTAGGVTGYSIILATGTTSNYTTNWEFGKQSASDTYTYSIPSGFSQF